MAPIRAALLFVALLPLLGTAPELRGQDIVSRASNITVGGRLQTQLSTSSVDAAENDFLIRRGRLTFDVGLTDRLDGRLQPEFGGGSASLKDAYLRLRLSPEIRISVGQFKRAFDLFELSSSTDLSLIERDGRVEGVGGCTGVGGVCTYSRLTEKLEFADRDLGVRLDGSRGRVSWLATVTNGTGTGIPDENDAKSFSGRVGVALTDALTVSGQLAVHDYVSATDDGATAPAWSLDVQHGDWRDGFLLQAAVAGGENWRPLDEVEPLDFFAAQAVASVYLPVGDEASLFRGVEPLARVSWADPDTATDDDAGVLFTPGLMLYVTGKNKIGANVDVYSPQGGDTEWSLKLQTFLYF